MLRAATIAAVAVSAAAFMPSATPGLGSMSTRKAMTSLNMAEKVNLKIDLDSPKVATMVRAFLK